MAKASVRLRRSSKESLDRLHAALALLGRTLTKQELLDLVLAMAAERPSEVLARIGGNNPSPAEADVAKALKKALSDSDHWGRTSWKDLDELAYGKAKAR